MRYRETESNILSSVDQAVRLGLMSPEDGRQALILGLHMASALAQVAFVETRKDTPPEAWEDDEHSG